MEKPIKAKTKQLNTDDSLREQPFFKQSIRKPRVKNLRNHELLSDLPFYDVINVLRKARAFKKYTESYEVEIINNKSLSDSFFVSKNSIKTLLNDLLREKKGFKYLLTNKITLKKLINDNEPKYETVYFNSKASITLELK